MNKPNSVEPIFRGLYYHIKLPEDEYDLLRETRAKLDVVFVKTPSKPRGYTYRALKPADDVHLAEFRNSGLWDFDSICTHLAQRSEAGADPLRESRKRVVDLRWIDKCIQKGRWLARDSHDKYEIVTRDKFAPSVVPLGHSSSGILTPLTPNSPRSLLRSCLAPKVAKVAVDPRLKGNVRFASASATKDSVQTIPIMVTPPSPPLTASDTAGELDMTERNTLITQVRPGVSAFTAIGAFSGPPSWNMVHTRQLKVLGAPERSAPSHFPSSDLAAAALPISEPDVAQDIEMPEMSSNRLVLASMAESSATAGHTEYSEVLDSRGLTGDPAVHPAQSGPFARASSSSSIASSAGVIPTEPRIFDSMSRQGTSPARFFIASGDTLSHLEQLIKDNGGLIGTPTDATFVIVNFDVTADNDVLEADVLEVLASINPRKQLPVSHQWIEACVKASTVVDMTPFVVKSPWYWPNTSPIVPATTQAPLGLPSKNTSTLPTRRCLPPPSGAFQVGRSDLDPILVTHGLTPPHTDVESQRSKAPTRMVKRAPMRFIEDLIYELDDWLNEPAEVRMFKSKTSFLHDLRKKKPENDWRSGYYTNKAVIRERLIEMGHSGEQLDRAGINARAA